MSLIKYAVFHPWRVTIVLVVGILVGTVSFYTYQINTALGVVASEEFDPVLARGAIEQAASPQVESYEYELPDDPIHLLHQMSNQSEDEDPGFPTAFGTPIADDVFESYLLLGTDAGGVLADAIILGLQPNGGGAPIMVSLPRDLYVWNLCKDRFSRLNEGLAGCSGLASSAELMAIMVEDYTGIPVDHLARINFGGFTRLVDAMGGVTVCVDYPTLDPKSGLDIPAPGCHLADGGTALAWVRSRSTQQLIDGEWKQIVGSDFVRQRRQQDVLFQLAARAATFSSPASLVDRLSAVASSVRLDSSWSFADAVAAGWRYRGIDRDSVRRFSIGTRDYRSPGGAAVLVPTSTFTEELAEVYPLS